MLKLLFILSLIAIVVLSCTDDNPISTLSLPVGGLSAGKALSTDSEACYLIQWDCDPSLWIAPEDSIFTIFYGDSLRFQTQGTSVHIEHYVDSNRKLVYYAHETESPYGRYKAAFRFSDGQCGLWSDAVLDNSLTTRIYKGNVKLVYRDLPVHKQYQIKEGEKSWKIATIKPDGTVVSVDHKYLPINRDIEGNLILPFSEAV